MRERKHYLPTLKKSDVSKRRQHISQQGFPGKMLVSFETSDGKGKTTEQRKLKSPIAMLTELNCVTQLFVT